MACVFLLGVVFSYVIFIKKYSKKEAEIFFDYSPLVILFSLIGARLFYVLGGYKFYCNHPSEIFMINHGGLSIFGAIIFGILSIYLLSRIKKFNFLAHLDILAVVLPFCQSIGRWGNYFNQEAYGRPCDGFLKLYVDKPYRQNDLFDIEFYHPTFLYESVLDLAIFFILFSLLFGIKTHKNGLITLFYLIFYSIVRYFVEGFRIDSVLNICEFQIARVICLIIFIISLILLVLNIKKRAQ